MTFGSELRKIREAKPLGLRETARRADLSNTYLSRMERDKDVPPSPPIIKRLAEVLEADLNELLALADKLDPEIAQFLKDNPAVLEVIRTLMESQREGK